MESKLAPRAEGPARSRLTLHCLALSLEVSQAEFRPRTEGEVEAQRGEFTCPGLHREVTTLLSSPRPPSRVSGTRCMSARQDWGQHGLEHAFVSAQEVCTVLNSGLKSYFLQLCPM